MERIRITGLICVAILASLAGQLTACSGKTSEATVASSDATPPAVVEKIAKDSEQTTITLTEQAEQRLGVVTVTAKRMPVTNRRVYGGTVISKPNQTVAITAPLTGTLVSILPGRVTETAAGTQVNAGDTLVALLPLSARDENALSAVERDQMALSQLSRTRAKSDATARLESARIQVNAAEQAYERAQRLLNDNVGSQRSVEEAKAALAIAREALTAARAEHETVTATDAQFQDAEPFAVEAPISGTVQRVYAVAGAVVSAGQPLIDVVDGSSVWIKIPVPASEAHDILRDEPAILQAPGKFDPAASPVGSFVFGEPTADPLMATVDVYCEFAGAPDTFRIGQRILVHVPISGSGEYITVPRSAIVFDVYGGAWVYVRVSDQTYRRSRVEMLYAIGDSAVIARGLSENAAVVTDGAAELFGAEFGNDA